MNVQTMPAMPDIIDGLPNFCGAEDRIEEVMSRTEPVFLHETNLQLDRLRATFSIALHMQQPLIPAGGDDLRAAKIIGNLEFMTHHQDEGDNHNAPVFAECYARIGDLVPELIGSGHNPRVMLDYSGQLFYGLRQMGRDDVLDRLRGITCDPHLRKHVEWLGTMWGHAVVSSTPPPDLKLHIRAWQQHFGALYGWDALSRVRGFSPPEMHLPNHPDVAYQYVKALKECGYQWVMVQEHTVETLEGHPLEQRHLPHRLVAKNSCGEEVSIIAVIKTQGSDTKLVAQMQPYYEADTLSRMELGGISVPPIVTQIGDGENGGVMMNEFPDAYRQTTARYGTEGVVGVNVTEYLEMLEQAGVREDQLPAVRPIHQGQLFEQIEKWEPGAADKALVETEHKSPEFFMEGGSWTNDISWVRDYENVLTPMNKLSADFHQHLDQREVDKNTHAYRNALFHLLTSQTSCYRYWGQGRWTDYAQEICRRGFDILAHDFS